MINEFIAANGFRFRPYQIEYEFPISSESAIAIRNADYMRQRLNAPLLGLSFPVSVSLNIADDNGWAFFITLRARDAVPTNLDEIARVLSNYIEQCRLEVDA